MHRGHRCCGRHVSLGINCVDPCNNTLPYSIGGQSALRSFTHRAEPGLPPFNRPRERHVRKLQPASGRQLTALEYTQSEFARGQERFVRLNYFVISHQGSPSNRQGRA